MQSIFILFICRMNKTNRQPKKTQTAQYHNECDEHNNVSADAMSFRNNCGECLCVSVSACIRRAIRECVLHNHNMSTLKHPQALTLFVAYQTIIAVAINSGRISYSESLKSRDN